MRGAATVRSMWRLLLAFSLVVSACSAPAADEEVRVVALVRTASGGVERTEVWVPASGVEAVEAGFAARDDVIASGRVGVRRTHGDPLLPDQWGSARLSYDRRSELADPSGVVVAVLDTGVDGSHPDLAGRVLQGFDVMSGRPGGDRDPNGHGTHVAGIVAAVAGNGIGVEGFASGVRILPVRVLGANGYGDDADLAEGIIWAADNGADIINMSVGGAEDMELLRSAVRYASGRGVLLVASAGNEALWGNQPSFPAALPEVVAVGAVGQRDVRAMFSNTGPYVELMAPGSSIVSTWPGGRYLYSSGTSMAAPFVSAAAALTLASTGLRGEGLRAALASSALDLGAPGRDVEFGFGLVDPFRASGLAGIASSPPPSQLPGQLPGLPELPTFDLPPLPDPAELFALLPPVRDPSELLPELPEMPDLSLPSLPALPERDGSSPLPSPVRAEVSVEVSVSGGSFEVRLVGPRALVAYRQVSWVVYRSDGVALGSGSLVLDVDGAGSAALPAGWARLAVEYPGSLTTLPASVEVLR